ncbi:isocitrate/isopropylmalate family dehydrogenase [Acidaminobacter hydrogenoformans]|uniref:Isocitrate dehydrogenase (NAD+) n=1 Tax=Acidaminobacter hydrogenoformans DSM 2784 TaxID=1120920 RepID=A0A1G5S638_9FIRM|nr:isocitrate/isopropylmalate family dehydrogenase [Acidaminobacter hydrogenoformans]SCZ81805.1 isocitrate dehydrogenase (NAD+) [Acidaminobacter hydrogenoformans DSM 2784]
MQEVQNAMEKFAKLVETEFKRVEKMGEKMEFTDFKALEKIIIGIVPGDGIGPIIIEQAERVLKVLLGDEITSGRVELRKIEGLTIENRAALLQSVPEDVLQEIKKCHVVLKGPTMTPRASDPWPNLPSANATLRRELDLFANVRPVTMPEKGIDWTFYRENIEGAYIWGSKGIQVNKDIAVDFVVETRQGSERIAKAAFEFAKNNNKSNVTVVTKANIVKLSDGNFIHACKRVAEDYPGIQMVEKLVDVTAAKLADPEFNKGLQVFVLPNLYGDIITDIAAELQGGLGTAGAANIGTKYAVFEAIHGTAPFLIENNRGDYADPSSVLRAAAMLLSHVGYLEQSAKLVRALDICGFEEKKIVITSFREDASTAQYADYVLETLAKL